MVKIKSNGKFRKTKAHGLVGCLAFSLGLAGSVVVGSNYDVANAAMVEVENNALSSNVDSSSETGANSKPETGTTDATTSEVSTAVSSVPNGERNYNASVAITSEAGLGSGTLINEDTIVSVAHNFVHLNTKTNPITVEDNLKKTGDVYTATLPNGKQVKFGNDDVKYWNRDGFVKGFKNDLAVVKLKNKFTGETPALVHDGVTTLSTGDKVHVFGYPKGKLNPILDGKVEGVEDYGANIKGIAYQGSAPGMSGGGLYNAQGELIGVNQNGVEGIRSGGITFSKEQLDWVNAVARGENAKPVYLPEEPRNDDKGNHGKLVETDNHEYDGWIGELYEDGTYVVKPTGKKDVLQLNNGDYGVGSMFGWDPVKLGKIKKIKVVGNSSFEQFDLILGSELSPTVLDMTGITTLTDNGIVPLLTYGNNTLEEIKFNPNFGLSNVTQMNRMFDEASKLKLTDKQVSQLLKNVAFNSKKGYNGPLWRKIGVERLDLSSFDNSKWDAQDYRSSAIYLEHGSRDTKAMFKDLIGLKEVVFGDKFDFGKYARKNTPDAFIDTDLSGVEKVTFAGNKPMNDKFVKDWLIDVEKLKDKNKQGLYRDGKYVGKVVDAIQADKTYEDGVYTLGPVMAEKPADKVVTEVIEPTVEYVGDDSLATGSPKVRVDGKAGSKVTTTTYVEDGKGGYVEKVLDPVITPAIKTIIKVGTKPTEKVTVIEPKVRYVKDATRERGSADVTKLGTKGSRTVRTTYTVDIKTGDVTTVVGKPIEVAAGETVIEVGAKDKVEIIKGGGKTIERRTVYSVDSTTGKVTEVVTDKELKVEVTYVGDDTKEVGYRLVSDDGSRITVGTKSKVVTTKIEPKVVYEPDKTRDRGTADERTEGRSGTSVVTTVYRVDSKTGKITEDVSAPTITPATNTIVRVGVKDKVELIKGNGKTVEKRTVYTLDRDTGKVTEKVTITELKVDVTYKADDKLEYGKRVVSDDGSVVTIGTKPTELVEVIEPEIVYEADLTREKGLADLVTKGTAGKKVITIKHSVDPKTGVVTDKRQEPVITPATKTIVKVAAQPHVVTTAIPKGKVYVADNKRDFGTDNVVVDGKDGVSITTTSYNVDPTTGAVTGRTDKPVVTEPTMTMVYVGAKSSVKEVKGDDGLTYEELTEYSVDKDTGVVTPKVTRTLKGGTSTGPGDTPTVEVPKVEVPKVDIPKVDIPKVDIPRAEVPKVDTPKVDEPKVDTPKVDEPKQGLPTDGKPKVDAPKEGEDLHPDNTLSEDSRPPYLEKKLTLNSPVFEGKYKSLPKTGLQETNTTIAAVALLGIIGFLGRKRFKNSNK